MSKVIAATGHRPEYYRKQGEEWLKRVKRNLNYYFIFNRPKYIINGLCTGWDTMVAEAAMEFNIPIHAYVPFKAQGASWAEDDKQKRQKILDYSEKKFIICEFYNKRAFLIRDEKMVDDCDELVSLYNPKVAKGGTYYTTKYAEKNNKLITNFWIND